MAQICHDLSVSLEGNTRKMPKPGEENASVVKDLGCSDYSVEK